MAGSLHCSVGDQRSLRGLSTPNVAIELRVDPAKGPEHATGLRRSQALRLPAQQALQRSLHPTKSQVERIELRHPCPGGGQLLAAGAGGLGKAAPSRDRARAHQSRSRGELVVGDPVGAGNLFRDLLLLALLALGFATQALAAGVRLRAAAIAASASKRCRGGGQNEQREQERLEHLPVDSSAASRLTSPAGQ
jgi:hypothetical protein